MNPKPFTNLFKLIITPPLRELYRVLREGNHTTKTTDTVVSGKYVYSFEPSRLFSETVEVNRDIIKNMIHKRIAAAIAHSDKFFDIRTYSLGGTLAGDLLHKEEVFSIARSFQLQVLFDEQRFYLAVLAGLKIYNRIRLPEVLHLLGSNAITLPSRALCFAGKGPEARWRDGQILSISKESCIVRVPSIQPSEVTVSYQRVIPKLNSTVIKRLLHLKGSRTSIEQKIKQIRSRGGISEGANVSKSSKEILRDHIAPLFPLLLGRSRVQIKQEASVLDDLPATIDRKRFHCVSAIDGQTHVFDSLLEGLQSINFQKATDRPVAIFCTNDTKSQIEDLIAALNSPPDNVGGFRGMPSHFGIRLQQISDSPYVVNDIEEYISVAQSLTLSPDPDKQAALALIALSEEDETYGSPVPLYFRLKALLARTGHPSQMVEQDTLTNKYARWNLALNMAAKLGSIPWTLEDISSLQPVDLFLGFSFSSIRTEELGQSRNIAYVNVFDSAGTWRVFYTDGTVFSFEERHRIFPRIAAEAVKSATDEPRSLRLIEVHYNKRFGYKERQAIAEGILSLAPNASINFVSIADEHPIRFFDPNNQQMSCPRGTILQLGHRNAYVQTIEADRWSGLPRPLRIEIHRDFSTIPEDPKAVCERVLGLTRLNWRSVRDYSSLPVTILYSSLVAWLTNYFSLTDWKEIDHNLKRTPWFL
jgi:Piwi domain